jgi:hypothetical protein
MQILLNNAENGDLAIERGKTYVVAVSASSASSNVTCRVLETTGGVVGAVAGEEGTFTVQLVDVHGNNKSEAGDNVMVQLHWPVSKNALLTDKDNGQYEVEYTMLVVHMMVCRSCQQVQVLEIVWVLVLAYQKEWQAWHRSSRFSLETCT